MKTTLTNEEFNQLGIRKAEEMTAKGIKRGSLRWIYGNIKMFLDINPNMKIYQLPKFKELVIYFYVKIERLLKR